jgi:hypothetical protein
VPVVAVVPVVVPVVSVVPVVVPVVVPTVVPVVSVVVPVVVVVVPVVPVVVPVVSVVPVVVPTVVPVVPVVVPVVSVVPVVVPVVLVPVVVHVVPVVLVPVVCSHATRVSTRVSPCFRWAAWAGAPTVIVWPLWQRVTFSWPGPPPWTRLPPSCFAKATVTTASTLIITIAAATLRIDTLRLIPILPPCVGGLVLCLWLATLQVRVFFPPLG